MKQHMQTKKILSIMSITLLAGILSLIHSVVYAADVLVNMPISA